ncbi:MAG: hypothetical protein JST04_15560 [Bdellovibrionales bacterium]|nr:hypothetical protein [Bdellovibrionales bacterium]
MSFSRTFFLFIAVFLSAGRAESSELSATGQYLTATSKTECECSLEEETDAGEVKKIGKRFSAGQVVGRYCSTAVDSGVEAKFPETVSCDLRANQSGWEGGFIESRVYCPSKCLMLSKTKVITESKKRRIFATALSRERTRWKAIVPSEIRAAIRRRFPDSIPPIVERGELPDYELEYKSGNFFIWAPVTYRRDGRRTDEWLGIVVFFENLKKAKGHRFTWAAVQASSGKILYAGPLDCDELRENGKDVKLSPRLTLNLGVRFLPTNPMTVGLVCDFLGRDVPADHLLKNLSGLFGPLPLGWDAALEDILERSRFDDFLDRPQIGGLSIIDGIVDVHSAPSEHAPSIVTCEKDHLALISSRWYSEGSVVEKPKWVAIACDGKSGWARRKNFVPFPAREKK